MKAILTQIYAHQSLSRTQACDLMLAITQGRYEALEIAAFLSALQTKGASTDELLGLRDGLLQTGRTIDFTPYESIDIVGTGGDGKNTFNISTCAAFVVAGAGFLVSKHGNYASSSVSGASNVLEAHGVRFTADQAQLRHSIESSGVAYFHAPLFALGMKHVMPVRRVLRTPTVFNLLGPLVNPAQPRHQILGTANLTQLRLYKSVFEALGVNYGILSSTDGYDEISLTAAFKWISPQNEALMQAEDLGLNKLQPEELYGGDTPAQAVAIFDAVLQNQSTPAQREVVVANAAAAIGVLQPDLSPLDTVAMAQESLSSGKAWQAFQKFVAINQ